MKILVLNGPNLNMLGKRDARLYGKQTLADLVDMLRKQFPKHELEFFQSNHEGALIDRLQQAREESFEGVMANFGGLSHSSVALRDALELLECPRVEVHLTNIHAREEFRHQSITASAAQGVVAGMGFGSYILGIQALEMLTHNQRP